MWFAMRKVDLAFLDTAEKIYVVECEVGAARADVWNALVDPTTWSRWWPGVRSASYGGAAPPHGVGTFREATVGRQRYEERLLLWEEGRRWGYYIERATVPIARAQLECTELEDCGGGTRVRWTIAHDPRLLMRLLAPFFRRIMQRLLRRAMANLEAELAAATGGRARARRSDGGGT
jgi:hypothetical protein